MTADQTEFQSCLKAAQRGDPKAQLMLGVFYDTGRNVAQNKNEAVKWYTKAADAGNVKAQYNLALMYHTGQGVEKSLPQAVAWYSMAARAGIPEAQFNLALLCFKGEGTMQNKVEALKWMLLASINPAAGDKAAKYVKAGKAIYAELNPEERAQAQSLAAKARAESANG